MSRFKRHTVTWLLYSASLYFFFEYLTDTTTALIHTGSFVMNQVLVFYLNLLFLLPRLQHRSKAFIGINIILVILSSMGHTVGESFSPEESINHVFDIEPLLAHAFPSVLSIFGAFILHTYYKKEENEKKELEIIKAEKNFLTQQINPHFLFNTLNNIYSLSIINDKKAPDALLQLSHMLDYSLYGSREERVSIQQEIEYISNFIELYKLRDDDISSIEFDFHQCLPQSKITPMLLLPFVENAFKHGDLESSANSFIKIAIESSQNEILFSCVNTYTKGKKVDHIGGIGITNVSRRLELLYPKAHSLDIKQDLTTFSVTLKITTHEV